VAGRRRTIAILIDGISNAQAATRGIELGITAYSKGLDNIAWRRDRAKLDAIVSFNVVSQKHGTSIQVMAGIRVHQKTLTYVDSPIGCPNACAHKSPAYALRPDQFEGRKYAGSAGSMGNKCPVVNYGLHSCYYGEGPF
jgi:hypothetical protein